MQETGEVNWILKVENLQVNFNAKKESFRAVNNISFQLNKNETIGIVGESGSGKSVTALSIMRLLPQLQFSNYRGNISYNCSKDKSIDLLNISKREMMALRGNKIAMIFQEPMTSLNPVYTCGDQVAEVLIKHKNATKAQAKKDTLALFVQVELPDASHIYNSFPHQLSGGQKQRVMIAMAICCKPKILIADEPTTALDVTVQSKILDLLKILRDENEMAVIFITHDLGVIAEIADRIIVMYQGNIVEQGTVWEIFSNPQHPYTKGLLACRPRTDVKLKILPTVADFMSMDEIGNMTETASRYNSVGEAILDNFMPDEEVTTKGFNFLNKAPHLEVKNLKNYFNAHQNFFFNSKDIVKAVDDVSFDVYPGETLGLVGESGCGKSTLGRTILRLLEPTSGEVLFEGKNIFKIKNKELRYLRKDIQIIFQDPYASLNPSMTIGESILEPMRVNRMIPSSYHGVKRVQELLEMVNLNPDFIYKYPHEFSGGQRQRICIARVLALNPKFIICDESVSALDVSVQAQILNLLNKLKVEFKFTCIFISHNLAVVKFMADRIMVMNKGRIEEIGSAENIYHHPQSAYTRQLVNAIPKGDLEQIRRNQLLRGY